MTGIVASPTNLAALPDLDRAQGTIDALVEAGAAETLDEARRQSEANALYERRAGYAERADHFARLKILAEAALGVLSFADSSVVEPAARRTQWRALAAAFERGTLLAVCDQLVSQGRTLATDVVAAAVRAEGYTYVQGKALGCRQAVPWARARGLAREQGVPAESLPVDKVHLQERYDRAAEHSRFMRRAFAARERLERMQAQKARAAAARATGPQISTAYGLLRRSLQALHDAQAEIPNPADRRQLGYAILRLYDAEEHIAVALGLRGSEELSQLAAERRLDTS